MKTITSKIDDELHLQLKALAKAYGGYSMNDMIIHIIDGAIGSIENSCADFEIYEKELKRLKNK